jgi:hypothetical protein
MSGFNQPGQWCMQFTTQPDGVFQASTNNVLSELYFTGAYGGVQFTKNDPGTDGSNFNALVACKLSGLGRTAGIGLDIDAGEYITAHGCDISSWDTSVRVNDDVCAFFGLRTDGSNIGILITTNGRDHVIVEPTGNGSDAFIQRESDDTPGIILRQGWPGSAWVGDVPRTVSPDGSFTSNFTRAWRNGTGATQINIGDVAYLPSGGSKGELRRAPASSSLRNLFVCVQTAGPTGSAGEVGQFATPGSVCEVAVDAAAVTTGDTLVMSTTVNGHAMANNGVSDAARILGVARTSKAAGSNGFVEAYIT